MPATTVFGSRRISAVLAAFILLQAGAAFAEAPSVQNPDSPPGEPMNVIFDTDIYSDIDDAMALAMLHALQDRHEINLVAVTVNTDEKWCASFVDLVDTFYGHPDIPIGIVHGGITAEEFRARFPPTQELPEPDYTRVISQRTDSKGGLLYPHRLIDGSKAPHAVGVLRKTLAAQSDASVVMVEVGYQTNLARLLESGPDSFSPLGGHDLVARKVRLLSVMGGNFGETRVWGQTFNKGAPEFNLFMDVASAQAVFRDWPTPIVASGWEIGATMHYPGVSIDYDYSYVKHHPIADTYRLFCEERKATLIKFGLAKTDCPHDHATFDLTAVLYAARPDREYFSLSKPGSIAVLPDGGSRFDETERGTHRYLVISDEQRARTLEAMVMLASQPPVRAAEPARH